MEDLHLPTFVPDESDNHGVEVEEEHEQVETELDEGLLLVHVQLSEDLSGVEQVLVLEDPVQNMSAYDYLARIPPFLLALSCFWRHILLLRVPCNERQVQQQRQPVAVDQEQYREESVDAGFGHNVHVEAVAQVDGVDVVAFEIGVHDGEEDLEEQVDGIEKDCEEE